MISDTTDLLLGVGSGVIQDLCKYVSFKRGLPYFIAAAAPSMDGYAAAGVIELQNRAGIYGEDKISVYKEKWKQIRKILEAAPSSDEIFIS